MKYFLPLPLALLVSIPLYAMEKQDARKALMQSVILPSHEDASPLDKAIKAFDNVQIDAFAKQRAQEKLLLESYLAQNNKELEAAAQKARTLNAIKKIENLKDSSDSQEGLDHDDRQLYKIMNVADKMDDCIREADSLIKDCLKSGQLVEINHMKNITKKLQRKSNLLETMMRKSDDDDVIKTKAYIRLAGTIVNFEKGTFKKFEDNKELSNPIFQDLNHPINRFLSAMATLHPLVEKLNLPQN